MLVWERSELLDVLGECAARMGFAVSAGGPSGFSAGHPNVQLQCRLQCAAVLKVDFGGEMPPQVSCRWCCWVCMSSLDVCASY